jgi:hypothetical protein
MKGIHGPYQDINDCLNIVIKAFGCSKKHKSVGIFEYFDMPTGISINQWADLAFKNYSADAITIVNDKVKE